MKLIGVLIYAALALSAKAYTSDVYSWQFNFRKIAHSDYIVKYDNPTESLSFYNPSMDIVVTFDGEYGVFGVINTTSGNLLMNYPSYGTAKFVNPGNARDLTKAFTNYNNLTYAFKEAAKAVRNDHARPFSGSSFEMHTSLAELVSHKTNVFSQSRNDILSKELSGDRAGFKMALMEYAKYHIFYQHNTALMLLGTILTGSDWTLRVNFLMLMSTIIDVFDGKFNKELMTKVKDLILYGGRDGFSKNVFNSLIAAISLVGPRRLGLSGKVNQALHLAY